MRALVCFLLAVVGVSARAAVVSRTIERWLPATTAVAVVHRYGDVNVTGAEIDSIMVTALVRVEAGDNAAAKLFADQVRLAGITNGDSTVVRVVWPPVKVRDSGLAYAAEIAVTVPVRTGVVVSNAFGDVRAEGVDGRVRLENRYGDIEAVRLNDCAIASRYGRVRVEGNRGRLAVNSSFGDVRLVGGDDTVTVDNRYGSVEVRGSRSHARVANRWGGVLVVPHGGAVQVDNHYGDVEAEISRADVATLELAALAGDVRLMLARSLPFSLHGVSENGTARVDRPLAIGGQGAHRVVSGRLGDGGPLIEVRAVGGDIEVDRR